MRNLLSEFYVLLIIVGVKMGALTSRQHAGVEEADVVSNHAYKYPPRSGKNVTFLLWTIC